MADLTSKTETTLVQECVVSVPVEEWNRIQRNVTKATDELWANTERFNRLLNALRSVCHSRELGNAKVIAADALQADQNAASQRSADETTGSDSERTLRRLLAFAYSAPGELYGDDGELQNGAELPVIDFKRDSVVEIERKIHERGMRKLAKAGVIQPVETTRQLSATDRLHNLCDALSEHADQSPFTREEWAAVDKQTARLNTALRSLIDAVRNVEIEKRPWDLFVALPLQNAYRALRHEDALDHVESLEERAEKAWEPTTVEILEYARRYSLSTEEARKLLKAERASMIGAVKTKVIPCVWQSGCKNHRICDEMGCCQQLGAENGTGEICP